MDQGTGRKSNKVQAAERPEMSGATERPSRIGYPGYGYGYHYLPTKSGGSLRDYVKLAYRFRALILLCGILGFLCTFFFRQNALPIYESTALVNIGASPSYGTNSIENEMNGEAASPLYMNNLIALLDSYAIAREALLLHPELVREMYGKEIPRSLTRADKLTPEAAASLDLPVHMLDHYLSHITTHAMPGTSLVNITAHAPSAYLAAQLANAHAEAFTEMVRKQRSLAAQTAVEFLEKRYLEAKKSSESAEQSMIEMAKKYSLPIGVDVFEEAGDIKHSELLERLTSAVEERAQTSSELHELTRALRSTSRIAAVSDKTLPIATEMTKLASLRQQFERSGRDRRALKNIDRNMKGLQQLLKETAEHEVYQSRIRQQSAREKERILRNELRTLQTSEQDRYTTKIEYALLVREVNRAKKRFSELRERYDEASVAAESNRKTVTVVDPALVPNKSLPLQKASSLLSGLLAGLCIGLAIALFINSQDSSVRSLDDIPEISQTPMLGMVPSIPESFLRERPLMRSSTASVPLPFREGSFAQAMETLLVENDELDFGSATDIPASAELPIVVRAPLSRESEAFRSIRATLQICCQEPEHRVILITSSQKGDGKTTLSTNLAICLASTHKKVVLVDGDLRLSRIHSVFGVPENTPGLSDYLISRGKLSISPSVTFVEDLYVLPAGTKRHQSPSELLSTPALGELMKRLKEEFDYVIVDAPPIADMSDALLLSKVVDGVVLVVRSGHTSKAALLSAHGKLTQIRAEILGLTLNGTETGSDDYHVPL